MAHSLSTSKWPRYYTLLLEYIRFLKSNPSLAASILKSYLQALNTPQTRRRFKIILISIISLTSASTILYYQVSKAQSKRLSKSSDPASGNNTPSAPSSRRSSVVNFAQNYNILVPYKNALSKVTVVPTRLTTFQAHRRLFFDPIANNPKTPVGVNTKFIRQFAALWAIIVPRLTSKSSMLLLIHTFFLFLRTYLSLVIAKLDGQIVRDLIAANGKQFLKGLAYWLLIAVPASYTNSMIKFLQSKLSIEFRTRLVRYIHDIYLDDNLTFYKINNIDGGVQGVDQYITADLTKFCDAAASLYSNLGKPSVDFVIFSYQLSRNLGPLALIGIFANYSATAWLLKSIAPPFGKLAAIEAKLEGDYRTAHSRLITNAEEIAFYDGTDLERSILTKTYNRLVEHIRAILHIKVSYNMFEDFVLKYSWSALGYMFSSLPVFLPDWSSNGSGQSKGGEEKDRMRQFITNKRLMLSLADAGGRMMYSIKDLAELAGYTSRVFNLMATLHRVQAQAYGRNNKYERQKKNKKHHRVSLYSLEDVRGTIQEGYNGVRFENTPIVAPGLGRDLSPGDLLVQDLNIIINPGEHLLISGPNGSGKSSVARVLGGLWPVFRGLVSKPLFQDISFLPQRPYLTVGTLREQIIYPYTQADMAAMGYTDADLMKILDQVKLEYLVSREGGFETRKQWKDVFSGGEKQRVMFARILFKNPKFAVIDEGTSAVSSDVEGLLYETCQKAGITLITISHRPSLLQYHKAQLKLGQGEMGDEWVLEKTDSKEARLSVEREIKQLEEKLGMVEKWQKRRAEIVKELSSSL